MTIKVRPFSRKQAMLLAWWTDRSPYSGCVGVIADGAIRSGKSFALATGFVLWAMDRFDKQQFALCGKTIKSLRRNILSWLLPQLTGRGYEVLDLRGDNLVVVRRGRTVNYFYLFGGRDERSQDLIQGITLAGCLLDEAQLMPESFVNQATGRCSVEGAKLWMSCNPEGPGHFLKRHWIDRWAEKRLLHLRFTMDDNPSLSVETKERYRRLYGGVFYRRFVLGLWAEADGSVYPMFERARHVVNRLPAMRRIWVGVDYGHTNPTVFLLLGEGTDRSLYVIREYVHEGALHGAISPRGYSAKLRAFLHSAGAEHAGALFDGVFVDPSAEGFLTQLREDGVFRARRADNRVLAGIQLISGLLEANRLFVHAECRRVIAEFEGYRWDGAAQARGLDKPVKKNDHAMDALRYGAMADRGYWVRGETLA